MAAYLNGGVVAMLMTSVSDSLSGLKVRVGQADSRALCDISPFWLLDTNEFIKHGAIAVGYSRIIDWRLWVAWLFAAASKDFAFL